AELLDAKLRAPAVVDEGAHADLGRLRARGVAMQHDGGDEVVAVGEDVGFDDDVVPLDAFRRKGAVVDGRLHSFDDDPRSPVVRYHVADWCEGRAPRYRRFRSSGRTRHPRMRG